MSYTITDLENEVANINTELSKLRESKGHDYSGTDDTLDNLRDFGALGAVVRIGDKFKRIKHFFIQKNMEVKDETAEDTMLDLINYAYFLLILYRQEKK